MVIWWFILWWMMAHDCSWWLFNGPTNCVVLRVDDCEWWFSRDDGWWWVAMVDDWYCCHGWWLVAGLNKQQHGILWKDQVMIFQLIFVQTIGSQGMSSITLMTTIGTTKLCGVIMIIRTLKDYEDNPYLSPWLWREFLSAKFSMVVTWSRIHWAVDHHACAGQAAVEPFTTTESNTKMQEM